MLNVAPGAPGSDARIRKRSVSIAGHATSLSLEEAFWQALKQLARAEGCSINALIARIDRTRHGNLSSAVRVYVLKRVKAGAGVAGATDSIP